jgi:CheY-like chemotaxis protein
MFAAAPGPAAPPQEMFAQAKPLDEKTFVMPELASQPIADPASPKPPTETRNETSPGLAEISAISANVSEAWFADSDNGIPAGSGPSVLIVDDEPTFRGFLKDALTAQGYRVHTAINGPNALRFIKQQGGIDLVIADLHMPHMDGFELKHEIDQIIGRAMPFIVCTADANEDKIQTAAQVGAAALVPKPIENLDAFFAIVTDTLKDAGVIARSA